MFGSRPHWRLCLRQNTPRSSVLKRRALVRTIPTWNFGERETSAFAPTFPVLRSVYFLLSIFLSVLLSIPLPFPRWHLVSLVYLLLLSTVNPLIRHYPVPLSNSVRFLQRSTVVAMVTRQGQQLIVPNREENHIICRWTIITKRALSPHAWGPWTNYQEGVGSWKTSHT